MNSNPEEMLISYVTWVMLMSVLLLGQLLINYIKENFKQLLINYIRKILTQILGKI